MLKATLVLHNNDVGGLDSIVFFNDGRIGIAEEKAWMLIDGDGHIVEWTWKETPESEHFRAYSNQQCQRIAVPNWADAENTCSPFSTLVFALTRKHGVHGVLISK